MQERQSDIIDISPLISERTAVWPGDVAFSRSIQCDIKAGSNIHLSSLVTTVHCGAHADAPLHYHRDGKSIDQVALDPYIGVCQVLHVPLQRNETLKPQHLKGRLKSGVTRFLFRTDTAPDPNHFNEDFAALTPEAIGFCADHGAVLLGIDTPSFDLFSSKDLPSHQELYRRQVRNLECLQLQHVEEGCFELIALPLKLDGFDASPVRAILRRLTPTTSA